MHKSVTHDFELPGGKLTEDGLDKRLVVTEILGSDQAAVAAQIKSSSPMTAIMTLLKRCVKRYGPYEKLTENVIREMLLGDVDACLLYLYKVSYPDSPLELEISCSGCGEKYSDEIPIKDVEFKKLDNSDFSHWQYIEEDEMWEVGKIEVVGGRLGFWIKDEKLGVEACFVYPTLGDTENIIKAARRNPLDAKHQLFAKCLKVLNGEEIKHQFNSGIIGHFPSRVLEFLDDVFALVPPGPDGPIITSCRHCGYENETPLVASDFLSRLVARQRTSKKRSSIRRR